MNLILFSFLFILITADFPVINGNVTYVIDALPAFVGYMILWYGIDKRQINSRMKFVRGCTTAMAVITFLGFLSQIRYLFADFLRGDGLIIGWILTGAAYLFGELGDLVLLISALLTGTLFWAAKLQWDQKETNRLQQTLCIAGMVVCGAIALCDLGALLVILPFSWHWISYPLSALAVLLLSRVLKDDGALENGIRS